MVVSCVTMATVMSIDTEHGWYYNSCTKCKKKKKVIPDGSNFFCEECNDLVSSIVPRVQEKSLTMGPAKMKTLAIETTREAYMKTTLTEMTREAETVGKWTREKPLSTKQ